MVDGAAARPLADKLPRDGTTGRLPAIIRAPLNCSGRAATGRAPATPNRPAFTVDNAREIRTSCRLFSVENRIPPCSGAIPPNRLIFVT